MTNIESPVVRTVDLSGMSPDQVALLTKRLTSREIDMHNVETVEAAFGTTKGTEILDQTTAELKARQREQNKVNQTELRTDEQLNLLASLLTSPAARLPQMAEDVAAAKKVLRNSASQTIFSVSAAIDDWKRMCLIEGLTEAQMRPTRWINTWSKKTPSTGTTDLTVDIATAAQDLADGEEESFA